MLPDSKAEQEVYRMHYCVTWQEREDSIEVHMKVLIGFNWLRLEKGGCVSDSGSENSV